MSEDMSYLYEAEPEECFFDEELEGFDRDCFYESFNKE